MSNEMNDQVDQFEEDIEAVEEAAEQSLPDEEKKSVNSVDQASGKTKRQPARKGDKLNAKDEPAQQGNVKFKEDLDALVDSEATLSESFREKAGVIFEAAFAAKVAEEVERLEEQYEEQLSEEVESIKEDLVEKVDGYLNYVVEQWMEDNKLAVESGLRTEIAEGFMSQLKAVFTEHYIQVPEAKVDLVDELAEQVDELQEQLGKVTEDNIELAESVRTLKREAIIVEASEGLTVAQAEKLAALAENVDFDSEASFTKKVATIKESYFPSEAPVIAEETEAQDDDEDTQVHSSPMMQQYLDAINKLNK
jgi:hypothetical protein